LGKPLVKIHKKLFFIDLQTLKNIKSFAIVTVHMCAMHFFSAETRHRQTQFAVIFGQFFKVQSFGVSREQAGEIFRLAVMPSNNCTPVQAMPPPPLPPGCGCWRCTWA
jgi:hypothetical protein